MTRRQERINSLLRELASSFIKTNFSSETIITIVKAEISDDLRLVRIFISVYPEGKEEEIISSLKKKEREFKNFLKSKIKMKFLPKISFEPDIEAKMERKIEEVLRGQ